MCANLLRSDATPLAAPTLSSPVMCADGHSRPLRLGVMGLVTPQVVDWDKVLLDGNLIAADIVETAQDMVPQMRAEGGQYHCRTLSRKHRHGPLGAGYGKRGLSPCGGRRD
jgi:2',3'-cyclic-nucleotide 2'-phosphodiesterase (5'-nucleotidase family)